MFAVIGANYECYFNDNSFSSVANALNLALESFGLNAMFTSNVTTGPSQLGVQFESISTPGNGIESWEWDLDGDGTTDSTEEDPYFLYTEMGTYSVTLSVTMEGETSILTQDDYISVTDGSDISGCVSGIWNSETNPFMITGDIAIPAGSQLIIEPGVEMNFADGTCFNVNGFIETQAPTDEDDPIIMTSNTSWMGIVVSDTVEDNLIMNCDISNVDGSAISVLSGAKIDIIGNRIFDNSSTSDGIINVDNAQEVFISQNIIANNSSTNATGGIKCDGSAITISNNIIVNNTGTYSALMLDGGSDIVLENNTFANNESTNGTPFLFYFFQSDPVLNNNIIIDNGTIWFAPFGDPVVTYSCITGGFAGEGNIDEDPLFIDPSVGNGSAYNGLTAVWGLLEGSPCIDAGDPDPMYNDPDGTRNDMGVYGGPNGLLLVSSENEVIDMISQSFINVYPNPFNPETNIALSISSADLVLPVTVEIYNIKGQLVKTVLDNQTIQNKAKFIWNGTDNKGISTTSGLYFVKLKTASSTSVAKMMLLK